MHVGQTGPSEDAHASCGCKLNGTKRGESVASGSPGHAVRLRRDHARSLSPAWSCQSQVGPSGRADDTGCEHPVAAFDDPNLYLYSCI